MISFILIKYLNNCYCYYFGNIKVAAQNCRKRKLDQILSLADEVKQMKDRKFNLLQEREYLMTERMRVKTKYDLLYNQIFAVSFHI